MTNREQARYCNGGEAAHWPVGEERYARRERDRIAVSRVAALSGVVIEPAAGPLWMGPGVAGTAAFLEATGIWTFLLRGAGPPATAPAGPAAARAGPAAARAGLVGRAAPEPYLPPDGLRGSRAWLVTASTPWR